MREGELFGLAEEDLDLDQEKIGRAVTGLDVR